MTTNAAIHIEVAPGELIDRIAILEIKLDRIADESKLKNVRYEYQLLSGSLSAVPMTEQIQMLRAELKAINETLWDLEDNIRDHGRAQEFGESFVALARSVYQSNDRRANLKRQINEYLGSAIIEEKSYSALCAIGPCQESFLGNSSQR